MLSISYSQALADPTYCDTGKAVGLLVIQKQGVKANQPVPLSIVMQHATVLETLWCLRAVKTSLMAEADEVAWRFTHTTLERMPEFVRRRKVREYILSRMGRARHRETTRTALIERVQFIRSARDWSRRQDQQFHAILRALSTDSPSQIAIDVAQAAIHIANFDGVKAGIEEERRQQTHLQGLLNG